jgi:hypothetical protein
VQAAHNPRRPHLHEHVLGEARQADAARVRQVLQQHLLAGARLVHLEEHLRHGRVRLGTALNG